MARQKQKAKTSQRSKTIVEFLKKLPDDRRIYYRVGNIMVEVTKKEAIALVLKEGEDALKKIHKEEGK